MGDESMGFASKLGIHANNPVEASFDFISEDLVKVDSHIAHAGVHGLRGEQSERIRSATYNVGGPISMQPCPEEMALLLPWAMGANASGTTFALAETLPERYVTIDRVTNVFTYTACKVNTMVVSGSEGSPVGVEFGIIGKTESKGNSGTFPSLTNTAAPPFMFHDASITIAGNSEVFKNFRVTLDNGLFGSFNNSRSLTSLVPGERKVMLELGTPFTSSEADIYDMAVAGVAVVLTLTNGGYSWTFTFPKWQVPPRSPNVPGKQSPILLPLSGQCRRSGTTQEMTCALDSTA